MRGPTLRFRVADETPTDLPRQTCFTIEEFRDGDWTYYSLDYLPVSRPTLAEAQELVARLDGGEDIGAEQQRGPGTKWWTP